MRLPGFNSDFLPKPPDQEFKRLTRRLKSAVPRSGDSFGDFTRRRLRSKKFGTLLTGGDKSDKSSAG